MNVSHFGGGGGEGCGGMVRDGEGRGVMVRSGGNCGVPKATLFESFRNLIKQDWSLARLTPSSLSSLLSLLSFGHGGRICVSN